MTHTFFARSLVLALAALAAACTMKEQQPPAVSGPSEFGTSIAIAIAPDILQQDGVSQSMITVTARGPNGALAGNVALRAEIRVDGALTDFGALSSRNLVTGSDGRAMLVYTAPPQVPFAAQVGTTDVDIGITPVGTDSGNASTRFARLRLVPAGVILPPAGLQPAFTATPTAPTANQTVLFDASLSQSPANNPIVSYGWAFGDGQTATGRTVSHQYSGPGTYVARLTITDGAGRSAQTSQSITVTPGANPVAQFTFSPTAPVPNQSVHFNAAESLPAPGRTIASYRWDFGDGKAGASGMQASRAFSPAGSYTVTLTVTDDTGRTHTISKEVAVAAPTP